MHDTTRAATYRPGGWAVVALIAMVVGTGVVAGALVIRSTASDVGGIQNPATALADFQETGVLSATTPRVLPTILSALAAHPTRLAAVGTPYLLNTGTIGNLAIEWTFSESVGILANFEVELAYDVQYDVAATLHTATGTVYLETQAIVPGGALTFELYWDSGSAAGVTFVSESEIGQGCSAVGTCP
jgi:hypothetical protein